MAQCFADFTLDPERRQLLRSGSPVALEPKAFDLLSLLLARRPRVLSKAQIREVLWPGTYVSESALTGLVADLRAALHDAPRKPRFIRTVHGFGYAFCGDAAAPEKAPRPASACGLLWDSQEIPLEPGDNFIGRGEGCIVRSRSVRVSRRHACIRVEGERAILEDLGSRNGTLLAGKRIEGPVELRGGDVIEVGPEEVVFLAKGDSGTTEGAPD